MITLVRVELHNATYQHYQNLHAAMKRARFNRSISNDTGQRYALPTAEYSTTDYGVFTTAYDAAFAAAKSVGLEFGIIVSEIAKARWDGLKTVTLADAIAGI